MKKSSKTDIKTSATILAARIRRAERRALQRIANVKRAKLFNSYRKKNAFPAKIIKPKKLNSTYFIGCSGWFYWHWRGKFYPATLETKKWFAYYTRYFNTVELNAPFYSWPTLQTVETWIKQAGKTNFVYTIKVSELITHVKKFSRTKELIKDFDLIATELSEQMGCFLYQLPPSFSFTPKRLKNIVDQLIPGRRNVIEFRHKSWWNDSVYKAFKKHKIIFCSVSSPNLPDELIKTHTEIYIRFHGRKAWYRHDYSKEEIAIWAERIKKSKAKHAWIYFNNDNEAYAIKNAKALAKKLT